MEIYIEKTKGTFRYFLKKLFYIKEIKFINLS